MFTDANFAVVVVRDEYGVMDNLFAPDVRAVLGGARRISCSDDWNEKWELG